MAYLIAQGFLRVLGRITCCKGAKAIHLSRMRTSILDQIQDIEKAREEIIKQYGEMDGGSIKQENGLVVFRKDIDNAALLCKGEIDTLLEGAPIFIDLNKPSIKMGANFAYGILTGEECPDVGNDFWFHEFSVGELAIALEKAE